MLCRQGNTHRNNICRVILFHPCSWHLQKRRSKTAQNPLGTEPQLMATSRLQIFSVHVSDLALYHPNSCKISVLTHLGMLSFFEYRAVPFSLQQILPQLYTCNRPLFDTHLFSSRLRTEKMSVPHPGGKAWWLSSNPRGSVLELVESLRDNRDESGAISSSCSDDSAVQIRRWKSV